MGISRGRLGLGFGAACAAALAWACSQGNPIPPPIGDPPPAEGGTKADVGADAAKVCTGQDGGCNSLANCGSKIYIVDVASAPPSPAGGTVVDGTYVLTDYKVFTGAGGTAGQQPGWFDQTMRLVTEPTDASVPDGGAIQQMLWEEISETNVSTTPSTATGTAYFEAPTKLDIDIVCPTSSSPFNATFTVSGNQLLLFTSDPVGTGQLTYTKQ